ncbi:MAG: DUF4097 domain-containing protein [Coriobacteriia bacterium]|nr:DUF4097 domain-containing protein [Coriobacteriia bacterium]
MSSRAAMKTVWVLILAAFLVGLGLAGMGVALGGNVPSTLIPLRFADVRTGTFYDRNMNSLSDTSVQGRLSETVREDIHTVSVSGVSARIHLVPADAGSPDGDYVSYAVYAQNPDNYRITVRNGRLSIEYRTRFSMGFFPGININVSSQDEIIVSVPQGTTLRDVNLQLVSGDVDVQAEQLVQIDSLRIDGVSTNIKVDSLGALNPSNLSVTSVSGSVNVTNSRLADFNVSQVSGSTTAHILNLDDFRMEFSTVSGSISKNGETLFNGMGEHSVSGTNGFIKVESISGSVNLFNITQEEFDAGSNYFDDGEEFTDSEYESDYSEDADSGNSAVGSSQDSDSEDEE